MKNKYLKLILAPFLGVGLLSLVITPIYLFVMTYLLKGELPLACVIANLIFGGFDTICFVILVGIIASNAKDEGKL